MCPLTRSCFLLLVLGRLLLLALPVLLGICPRSRWSPPSPLHALALIPLTLAKVRLSPILTLSPPHDLVLWTDGSVLFPLGKSGSGVLANCSLCGTETTLSFSAGPVCSRFSAKACAILHVLSWSRQHHEVCHFSSLLLLHWSASILLNSNQKLILDILKVLISKMQSVFAYHVTFCRKMKNKVLQIMPFKGILSVLVTKKFIAFCI